MTSLTVSVLIATYNRADLLPDALNSLLAQTRLPDEIIVVDDGSTDNTTEVLEQYGDIVKVIVQFNQGLPVARNVGLRASTGDLIAFLDSDDTLPPTSIEERVRFLIEHPAFRAVYGAAYMTDIEGKVLGWFREPPLPQGNIFFESVCRTVFPMHTVMFYRECFETVGFFDETLWVQLDFDYWIRFSSIYLFGAINKPIAYYRVHESMSVLTQSDEVIRKGILVQERAFRIKGFSKLTSRQRAKVFSVHATQHMLLGDVAAARQWYIKAIQTEPYLLRPYLLLALTFFGKQGLEKASTLWKRVRGQWVGK